MMKTIKSSDSTDRRSGCWRLGGAWGWTRVGAAVFLVGCAAAPYTPIDASMIGDYKLVSVDGKAVPCRVRHESNEMEITSGVFVIHAEGTCGSKITIINPRGAEGTIERNATYKHRNGTLTMKWKGAGSTVGTVAGDSFTMNNEGMAFAYRK
jgi:hypothetical protein